MSLSIGLLRKYSDEIVGKRYERDFVAINEVLQLHGLSVHTEPPASTVQGDVLPEVAWPTHSIHLVRYLAARWIDDPNWIPDASIQHKHKIPARIRTTIYQERRSHLICHSDFDGYYVPIDFEAVIFDETTGWIGSSQALRRELVDLAGKLGLDLGEYTPDLRALSETRQVLKQEFLGGRKWVLLCLYNIATASIHYGTAITFT